MNLAPLSCYWMVRRVRDLCEPSVPRLGLRTEHDFHKAHLGQGNSAGACCRRDRIPGKWRVSIRLYASRLWLLWMTAICFAVSLRRSSVAKCLVRKLCYVAKCRPFSHSFHIQSESKPSDCLSTWILLQRSCAGEEAS